MNSESEARLNGFCWMAAVSCIWLWAWRHLSVEWRLNDDYSFGFAVPFLAVYLAWQRLQDWQSQAVRPRDHRWLGLAGAGLLAFVPAELLRLQDPAWRMSGWGLVLAATLILIAWLGMLGGWNLVRHLALPIGFCWLAAPWPSSIESPVTLRLLGIATGVTVDLLNSTGIPAVQHGNLIELRNGMVGVDRACSGIQSLQASLMLALFAGELFRLTLKRRLTLLAGGVGLATVANCIRVFLLARYMHLEGEGAIAKYHDPVGAAATLSLVVVLLGAGRLLAAKPGIVAHSVARQILPEWRLPGKSGLVVLGLVILVPLGAAGYMARVNSGETGEVPIWNLTSGRLEPGWRAEPDPFAPEELKLLRFSEGKALNLLGPSGERAHVIHLFWTPDAAVPSLAYSHRPDICLAGAGWEQKGEVVPARFMVAGRPLPGSLFKFHFESAEQTVFHGVWYGGQPKPPAGPPGSLGDRFSRLALLWRDPGRRNHEIITVFLPAFGGSTALQLERMETLLNQVVVPVGVVSRSDE